MCIIILLVQIIMNISAINRTIPCVKLLATLLLIITPHTCPVVVADEAASIDNIPCSADEPCPVGYFCDSISGGDELEDNNGEWYCKECPSSVSESDESAALCYFADYSLSGAQDCADSCAGGSFASPSCRLFRVCKTGFKWMELQSVGADEGEEEEVCDFCPGGVKNEFADRMVPLFGENIATCSMVDHFFQGYNIPQDNVNCEIAKSFSYMCGCEGPGYLGANTEAKRNALVWMPRITAIISAICSAAIIIDVMRYKKKRSRLYCQLMVGMSIFDFMGSMAYSFTSLPEPKDDYILGSKGNDAACTTQGFFIQMGTIASFINTSLAVYYLLVIKYSWSDHRMMKYRVWLFGCPIAVGLAVAFTGIPYYQNLLIWCNNCSTWELEIPIVLAIVVVTIIMAMVCWHVFTITRAARKYTAASNSIKNAVFWQSFFYLLSFYLTWVTYLAVQFKWASGKVIFDYGPTLLAATLIPLQGFWNALVFFRAKRDKVKRRISSVIVSRFGKTSKPTEEGEFVNDVASQMMDDVATSS